MVGVKKICTGGCREVEARFGVLGLLANARRTTEKTYPIYYAHLTLPTTTYEYGAVGAVPSQQTAAQALTAPTRP